MKHKVKRVGVVVGIAVAMVAVTVYAANVHLKGTLSSQDNGTTDTVCGKLTGLGNLDVTITLVGSGVTTTVCTNPAGNFAPGVPGEVAVGATETIPATEIKNGNLSFCITTEAPTCETAKDCGCPNNNWTGTVTDVDFTSLTLVVEQGGQVVLTTPVQ